MSPISIYRSIEGLKLPLFVTVKPLDEYDSIRVKEIGWETSLNAESYPHIRGIGLYLNDDLFFWYPTKNILKTQINIIAHNTGTDSPYLHHASWLPFC